MLSGAQSELYRDILNFDIDGKPAELPFVQRLAHENGWRIAYAKQVITEYRRFLFLAMAAGHPVSPSSPVDRAWHLHLTYTVSYWDRLCGEVLGRPLHHHPSLGSLAEAEKYRAQYRQTLHSYQRIFGTTPDPDFWPRPRDLSEEPAYFSLISRIRNWVTRGIPIKAATLVKKTALVWGIGTAALILLPIFLAHAQRLAENNNEVRLAQNTNSTDTAPIYDPVAPRKVQTVIVRPDGTIVGAPKPKSTSDYPLGTIFHNPEQITPIPKRPVGISGGPRKVQTVTARPGGTIVSTSETESSNSMVAVFLIGIIGAVILGVLWGIISPGTCPACGKPLALEIGGRRKIDVSGDNFIEYRCKYCGHSKWEVESSCG